MSWRRASSKPGLQNVVVEKVWYCLCENMQGFPWKRVRVLCNRNNFWSHHSRIKLGLCFLIRGYLLSGQLAKRPLTSFFFSMLTFYVYVLCLCIPTLAKIFKLHLICAYREWDRWLNPLVSILSVGCLGKKGVCMLFFFVVRIIYVKKANEHEPRGITVNFL